MADLTYERYEDSYYERYENWKTAVGLQAVDGLKPSEYLAKLAEQQINGKIGYDDVNTELINYYNDKNRRKEFEKTRQIEADLVSSNIAKMLSTNSFTLSENSLKTIHKKLFAGFSEYTPGKYRTIDIIKSEFILDNDTIQYGHWDELDDEIGLLINKEQHFDYNSLKSDSEIVEHVVEFISNIWKLHAFLEGNTRTTAIFTIRFLRSMGYKVDNKSFEHHSKYFRNALVRANYWNGVLKVFPEKKFLMKFFGNLLLGEKNELKNRELHIDLDGGNVV